MTEFTVKSLSDFTFRDMDVSPIDLLAISTQIDFDAFSKTKEIFTFALEHLEVKVGDKWFPVKTKGREVYMPMTLQKNVMAISELCQWYVENVIIPVFPQSAE